MCGWSGGRNPAASPPPSGVVLRNEIQVRSRSHGTRSPREQRSRTHLLKLVAGYMGCWCIWSRRGLSATAAPATRDTQNVRTRSPRRSAATGPRPTLVLRVVVVLVGTKRVLRAVGQALAVKERAAEGRAHAGRHLVGAGVGLGARRR